MKSELLYFNTPVHYHEAKTSLQKEGIKTLHMYPIYFIGIERPLDYDSRLVKGAEIVNNDNLDKILKRLPRDDYSGASLFAKGWLKSQERDDSKRQNDGLLWDAPGMQAP